jgi:plastocyanin
MGYFNVTNASPNAIDGQDIASTKSINMNDWQMNMTKSLQKADPRGKITITAPTSTDEEHHRMTMGGGGMRNGMEQERHVSSNNIGNNTGTRASIVKGATTLGNKAFLPDHIKVKVGGTIIWTNDDSNIHTITSGIPNTPNAGQVFDSGLTSLIAPSKTYSHKFTTAGDVSERYIAKSNPYIVMVSTPNAPDCLFERIEKEAEDACLYKRIFLDYTYGIGKIYTAEEIQKAKASPSFEREYNLKYLGKIGNVFHTKDIEAAIEKGRKYNPDSFNPFMSRFQSVTSLIETILRSQYNVL